MDDTGVWFLEAGELDLKADEVLGEGEIVGQILLLFVQIPFKFEIFFVVCENLVFELERSAVFKLNSGFYVDLVFEFLAFVYS